MLMFEILRFIVKYYFFRACVGHLLLCRGNVVMQILVEFGIALEDFQVPARRPEKNDEF